MKLLPGIFFLLIIKYSFAQTHLASFNSIDWKVQSINADTPDSLAKQLTTSYNTDLEKVRAIFSWITQHIAYNTGYFNKAGKHSAVNFFFDPADTISLLKSANEMTAQRVLKRGVTVCDGYTKLFKILCDDAGINSVIISGYAKCYSDKNERFRTNHSWNAVMIDSKWYLLDVTWASGYINYANEYVQRTDDYYFLTPPKQFILDHYPEDMRWCLMENLPAIKEFQYTPFKYKSYVKYSINSYFPAHGIIEASVGDTVKLELQIKNAEKDKLISPDPFFDSTILDHSPSSAFLQPSFETSKVVYTYVVQSDVIEWLYLFYNNDIVLKYKLKIKKRII